MTIVAIILVLIIVLFFHNNMMFAILLYTGAVLGCISLFLKKRNMIVSSFSLHTNDIIVPLMSIWMIYQISSIFIDYFK